MTKLPVVYDAGLHPVRRITPTSADIRLEIVPLSSATLTARLEDAPAMRAWVEMFTPHGSAGIFRVAQIDTDYAAEESRVTLEHGICVLRDAIAQVTSTDTMMTAIDTRADEDDPVVFTGTPDDVMEDCLGYQAAHPGYVPSWAITTQNRQTYFSGSAQAVLLQILDYQTIMVGGVYLWQAGTVEATDQVKISVDYNNLLDLLTTMMEQLPDYMLAFDQSALPWRVSILHRPAAVSAEGRMSRNITRATISYDDSDMCTRIYMDGLGGDGYMDSQNTALYGIIGQHFDSGDAATLAEKQAICARYLNLHDHPMVSIEIDGMELCELTGDGLDSLGIGRLYRLALPDYGIALNEHIVGLDYSDVYGQPERVRVQLANDSNTLVSRLSEMKKRSSGGAARQKKKDEEQDDDAEKKRVRYALTEDKDDRHFSILATEEEWSDAAASWLLTHHTKFWQDARKFSLIASESEYDAQALKSRTLTGDLTLQADKLSALFTDTEYSDIQTLKQQGQMSMSASAFSLIFDHQDILDVLQSGSSLFQYTASGLSSKVSQGVYNSYVTQMANAISAVVDAGGNITPASIALAITNDSSATISADRIILNGQVIANSISAVSLALQDLMTGTATATLINVNNLATTNNGTITGSHLYGTDSVSVGSGSSGGSGTLYYRGTQFYNQGITLGPSTGFIAEGHFLGSSSTTLSLNHYHTITATEGTGQDAGKIILTLSDPLPTSDTSGHITNFNIAATQKYIDDVAAARTAGQLSVTLSDTGWLSNNTREISASSPNTHVVTVGLPTVSVEARGGYSIDEAIIYARTSVAPLAEIANATLYLTEDNGIVNLRTGSSSGQSIAHISGGGAYTIGSKPTPITANGTYYATDDGLDGYTEVEVNVSGGSYTHSASVSRRIDANFMASLNATDNILYYRTSSGYGSLINVANNPVYQMSASMQEGITVHW